MKSVGKCMELETIILSEVTQSLNMFSNTALQKNVQGLLEKYMILGPG